MRFEEIITDLTAISEEYISRTVKAFSIDRRNLSDIEIIFLFEVEQSLIIINVLVEEIENPYASNKMKEIIEKLVKCVQEILALAKLTLELS